ncbi:hypothetical protein [Priestia megaterium]|uniref:hypothetical protein n=1 Tax=Priestia megaterium TaxID=1404 RepID=UPI000BFBEA9B|nr:hypothetical protein [Priestia megaterium]PGO60647.1 hypothetical protein CN981_08850 [Priestia megaterium]
MKTAKHVSLHLMYTRTFEVRDQNNEIINNAEDDYTLCLKNPKFKPHGIIEGEIATELDEIPSISGESAIYNIYTNEWVRDSGKSLATASMIVIDNYERKTVIVR